MSIDLLGLSPVSTAMPWHQEAWEQVSAQWSRGQLPHALLLSGPAHSGKSRFALALARLLLCAEPVDSLNCGSCHPCELSAAGTNADLRWLQPPEKSRVIKIEQVRDAITFTQSTANFSPAKVAVFAPADAMNINAHNALLKSLEEPVDNTYLILVCDSLNGVPATIRSRCQMLRLPEPDYSVCLQWLQETTDDAALSETLMLLAEGRPLLAERIYREDLTESYTERRLAIRALLEGKLGVTDCWNAYGDEDAESFLQLLASELRLRLKSLGADELATAEGRALFGLLDETQQIQRAVRVGSNPGRQLLVDRMLSKSHSVLGQARRG